MIIGWLLLVRWGMLASLTLLIIKIAIDLIEHPLVITTAARSGLVYMILLALAVFIYGWFALFQTRAAAPEDRVALKAGTFWGVLCGLAWAAELMLANLPFVQPVWFNHALYYATTFAGFFLPLIAGLQAAYLTNKIEAGSSGGFALRDGRWIENFSDLSDFLQSIQRVPRSTNDCGVSAQRIAGHDHLHCGGYTGWHNRAFVDRH